LILHYLHIHQNPASTCEQQVRPKDAERVSSNHLLGYECYVQFKQQQTRLSSSKGRQIVRLTYGTWSTMSHKAANEQML
jgi:hypothetical protein